ncbi:MAG: 50S ribosomal protein L1 [Nitrososphaeraceae archaeon]|nr:50S ribosomal protein L1 [Nitrososphaeraceae archaeon]
MINEVQLKELVKNARQESTKRNFSQSVDLTLILKDIDIKKGFSLNEVVSLPSQSSTQASICVVASGDMGSRAKKAEVDKVIEQDELDRLSTNKKEAKNVARIYDFFLSDTALMANVGRSLGQFLGPRGKMPAPVPYGAPIESIVERFRNSVRVRVRNQLSISAKIGDEKMDDDQLVSNAVAVISTIEKKLPQGEKNIKDAVVKFTMGRPVKSTNKK